MERPRRSRHFLIVFTAVTAVTAVALAAGSAAAATVRVSQGEAKAVLKSLDSKAFDDAAIRPYGSGPDDGRHYCARDWHTAVVAIVHGGDATFTEAVAKASFDGTSASLILDGSPVATQRSDVEPYANPSIGGWVNAYYVLFGRVLSPTDLLVGTHTLGVTATDSVIGDFVDGITFDIDAAGTGACL